MPILNNKKEQNVVTKDYAMYDFWRYYRKEKKGTQDRKTFSAVYDLFIQNVIYHIIEKSAEFRMPGRLGDICILKAKQQMTLDENGDIIYKHRYPDWNKTIKLWEKKYGTRDKEKLKKIKDKPLIYYENRHTSGYTFYISWDKRTSNVKNQRKYIFKPARDFSRAVKKVQDIKKIDYYETTS